MDSGSVVFNLMRLNLFGSRCSAAAASIILLCEWYERFRSRFRCVLIQNSNVFCFFFIPLCSDALSLTKGHWKSIEPVCVRVFFLAFRIANHMWHKHKCIWTLLVLGSLSIKAKTNEMISEKGVLAVGCWNNQAAIIKVYEIPNFQITECCLLCFPGNRHEQKWRLEDNKPLEP